MTIFLALLILMYVIVAPGFYGYYEMDDHTHTMGEATMALLALFWPVSWVFVRWHKQKYPHVAAVAASHEGELQFYE